MAKRATGKGGTRTQSPRRRSRSNGPASGNGSLARAATPPTLAAVRDRVEHGRRLTVTREGESVAALLPTNQAYWCAALAARFRGHLPPSRPRPWTHG